MLSAAPACDDNDTARIWWHDTGVHQNLTFAVQPDPISGMHCWHQRVRVTPALADDEEAIYSGNLQATRDALAAAAEGRPAIEELLAVRAQPDNPFFRRS